MRSSWIEVVTLALLAPALAGCGSVTRPSLDRASEVREWKAPEGVVRVELLVDGGVVRVGQSSELRASFEIELPAADRQRLDEVEFVPSISTSGTARLAVITPDGSTPSVLVDLQVPPWVEVSIRSNSADVIARGIGSPLTVDSQSGRIDASFRGGSAELQTISGRIRMFGAFANADVRSQGGDIDIVLPGPASALSRLRVENDHGDVRLHGHSQSFDTLRFGTDSGSLRPMVPGDWLAAERSDVRGSKIFFATGAHVGSSAPLVVESRTGDLDLLIDSNLLADDPLLSDLARSR
ncbi:MAG: hypothetical protein AAF196_20165 [Planctomycetota bacterium]